MGMRPSFSLLLLLVICSCWQPALSVLEEDDVSPGSPLSDKEYETFFGSYSPLYKAIAICQLRFISGCDNIVIMDLDKVENHGLIPQGTVCTDQKEEPTFPDFCTFSFYRCTNRKYFMKRVHCAEGVSHSKSVDRITPKGRNHPETNNPTQAYRRLLQKEHSAPTDRRKVATDLTSLSRTHPETNNFAPADKKQPWIADKRTEMNLLQESEVLHPVPLRQSSVTPRRPPARSASVTKSRLLLQWLSSPPPTSSYTRSLQDVSRKEQGSLLDRNIFPNQGGATHGHPLSQAGEQQSPQPSLDSGNEGSQFWDGMMWSHGSSSPKANTNQALADSRQRGSSVPGFSHIEITMGDPDIQLVPGTRTPHLSSPPILADDLLPPSLEDMGSDTPKFQSAPNLRVALPPPYEAASFTTLPNRRPPVLTEGLYPPFEDMHHVGQVAQRPLPPTAGHSPPYEARNFNSFMAPRSPVHTDDHLPSHEAGRFQGPVVQMPANHADSLYPQLQARSSKVLGSPRSSDPTESLLPSHYEVLNDQVPAIAADRPPTPPNYSDSEAVLNQRSPGQQPGFYAPHSALPTSAASLPNEQIPNTDLTDLYKRLQDPQVVALSRKMRNYVKRNATKEFQRLSLQLMKALNNAKV